MGQAPVRPRYKKTFVNIETAQISEVTDLEIKINKRNNCFKLFFQTYTKHFVKKSLSILTVVVNQDEYEAISKFINTITRKLKRKGIDRLGYIWVRDIGDKIFEKHFHIIIATTRINKDLFKELFCKKKHSHYEVEFMGTRTGMLEYIKEKKLYAAKKQRSYGRSIHFPIKKLMSNKIA
jgi:hypothetical protein